jgi:trimeric autotransporter adhesin
MFDRSCVKGLLLVGLLAPIASCGTSPSLTSIVISPNEFTTTLVFLADGSVAPQSDQLPTNFTATGYYTRADHPAETLNITDQVTWFSYTPDLVTITSQGVATPAGLATGFSQITASAPGFGGDIISNAATYTVDLPSSTSTGNAIASISVQQPNQAESSPNTTEQFKAMGVTQSGSKTDLTTSCTWSSSNTNVATIDSKTGVVTTVGAGTTSIYATYKNRDGLAATGFTNLTVN